MGKKRQAEDRNEECSRETYFNEAEQEIIRTGLSVAKQKEEADKERAAILAQRKLQDTQWAQVQKRIAEEEASLLVKHAQVTEAERVVPLVSDTKLHCRWNSRSTVPASGTAPEQSFTSSSLGNLEGLDMLCGAHAGDLT